MSGTATISTMFWRLMGQQNVNITASGEVVWGIKKLNLALALDNTGSMSSNGKMTALKEAAHNLLATPEERREDARRHQDLDRAVRRRRQCRHQQRQRKSWIHWSHWEQQNGTCSNSNYTNYNSCISNNKTWTPDNHNTWNGCVKDRDQNNDVTATATGDGGSTKYRAHQASSCPTAMMPLSTDWTALNARSMQ